MRFNPFNPFHPFTVPYICFCSDPSSDSVANEKSSLAMTQTLQKDFGTAFSEQQSVLGSLQGELQNAVAKPTGYTPQMMAALRTGAVDTTNLEFNQAKASAASGAARYGGDVASGVTAQTVGGVAALEAETQSQEQNQITVANAQQQQQNYWRGIQGLTNVGAAYNPNAVASNAVGSSEATTKAAAQVQSEEQQGWQDAFGVVSGISGLVAAGTGVGKLAQGPAAVTQSTPVPPNSGSGGPTWSE